MQRLGYCSLVIDDAHINGVMLACTHSKSRLGPEMTAWRLSGGCQGVVPLTWMYLWPVQNIPCRTKGCRSTVLPPEAATMTSRYLAKANQRTKVQHRCCYPHLSDEPAAQWDHYFKKGLSSKSTHLTLGRRVQAFWLCVPRKTFVLLSFSYQGISL